MSIYETKGIEDTLRKPCYFKGQMSLGSPQSTLCAVADQFYKIDGSGWEEACPGTNSRCFEVDPSGTLIYTGPSGIVFTFSGSSDISMNTSLQTNIEYGLCIGGVINPKTVTPHTFDALNKKEGIAIASAVCLNYGDTIEVHVKSDRAGVTVTSITLSIVLSGHLR